MQEFSTSADKAVTEDVSTLTDFVRGFATSGIEKPVNALVEIADHISGAKLPKLDIVDDPTGGIASTAGSIVGTTAVIALLSYGTGRALEGLGASGTGLGYGTLRMGATGAVYGSVFTPYSGDGNFWADRAKSGIIEGTTWATIGAASGGLVGKGVLAQEGMRSLTGSILLGASSGAAGGVVNANVSSVLREGRLATVGETFSQAGQFAVAGAVFGAIHHVGSEVVNRSRASDLLRQKINEAPKEVSEAPTQMRTSSQMSPEAARTVPEHVEQVLNGKAKDTFYYKTGKAGGRVYVNMVDPVNYETYPGGMKLSTSIYGTPEPSFPRGTVVTTGPDLIRGVSRDGTIMELNLKESSRLVNNLHVRTQMPDGTQFFFEGGTPTKAILPDGRTFSPVKVDGRLITALEGKSGTHLLPDGTEVLRSGSKILPDGTHVYDTRGGVAKDLPDGTKILEGKTTVKTTLTDGTMEVKAKDGFSFKRQADGTEILRGARGNVKITHPDGTIEKITAAGVRTVKPPQPQGKPAAAAAH